MKRCSKCLQYKPLSAFYRDKYKSDGRSRKCKDCYNSNYIPHPRVLLSEEEKKLRIKSKGALYYQKNKEQIQARQKRHNYQVRLEVIEHYSHGTMACAHCGEKDIIVLCIDHIYGGGTRQRKTIRGTSFYYWLRKRGFPEGYQILCANCNLRKRMLNDKKLGYRY